MLSTIRHLLAFLEPFNEFFFFKMSIVNEVNCSSSFQIKYLIISYAEYVEQAVHLTNHEDHAHHRDHADRSDFAFQVFLMFDNTCCFWVALLDNTWLCTVHNTFFYCVLLSEGIEAGLVLYIPGLQTQEKCKYNVYNFKTSAILQLVEIQNQCKYKTHSFLINGNFLQRQNYWPKLLHLKCIIYGWMKHHGAIDVRMDLGVRFMNLEV